jgi:hypothetical protein
MWRGPERVRTRSGGNGYLFFPKLQAQCRKKNRISPQRLLFFILSIIEYHFVNGCCWNDLSTSHLLPSSPFPPLLLEHYPQQKPIYDKPPVVLSSHQHRNKYLQFHGLERECLFVMGLHSNMLFDCLSSALTRQ